MYVVEENERFNQNSSNCWELKFTIFKMTNGQRSDYKQNIVEMIIHTIIVDSMQLQFRWNHCDWKSWCTEHEILHPKY